MTDPHPDGGMAFTLQELAEIGSSNRECAARLECSVSLVKRLRTQLRRGVIDEPLLRFAMNKYWQRLMLAAMRDAAVHFNIPPQG